MLFWVISLTFALVVFYVAVFKVVFVSTDQPEQLYTSQYDSKWVKINLYLLLIVLVQNNVILDIVITPVPLLLTFITPDSVDKKEMKECRGMTRKPRPDSSPSISLWHMDCLLNQMTYSDTPIDRSAS